VHGDEAAPIDHITERHQQNQPHQVAELTGRDDPSGELDGQAEIVAHRPEDRLGGVDARHRDAAHHRQQQPPPCVHDTHPDW
jgi:hypothetical protein